MKKRINALALRAVLLFSMLANIGIASDRRLTPLVKAVQRAKTAVVNIHSEKTTTGDDGAFSGRKGRKVNGMGTGIVVDERGYIITNHHVVAGVSSLTVSTHDGSTYDAKVVSFDRKHDLAVIKIDSAKPLDVMPIGTSSDLMLGESVFAVGNAFGYEHTVTSGIVSALSRDVEVNETQSYENLIQTDASINPGNSGGPLLNLDGEVIGINVAIRAGAQRIGFAIPIDDARQILAKLLSVEELSHTYHGLKSRDIKLGDVRQLTVDGLSPNSPAANAGLKPGDVILRADDIEVVDQADFERAMLGRPAGDSVVIRVRRDDELKSLTLKLAEARPQSAGKFQNIEVVRANNEEGTVERVWRILGLRLNEISVAERQLVQPRYRGGMKVTSVRPGSPASENGMKAGDILVGLHVWETVNTPNIEYILDHPQLSSFNPLKFYILRGEETLYGHLQLSNIND